MGHDLRFALRTLARSPLFTAVAVLSLALGIGANTSIFSLLDQVLYRSLPVRDPRSLVVFHVDDHSSGMSPSRTINKASSPIRCIETCATAARVFSGVVGPRRCSPSASPGTGRPNAPAPKSSPAIFSSARRLRRYRPCLRAGDDGAPSAHPVIMLSHDYWVRRFAGEPGVLNVKVAINGHPMVVVGVAPAGFRGVLSGEHPEVFVPIAMKREVTPTWDGLTDRRARWLDILARLKPGISPAQAQAAIQTVYRPIMEAQVKSIPSAANEPSR